MYLKISLVLVVALLDVGLCLSRKRNPFPSTRTPSSSRGLKNSFHHYYGQVHNHYQPKDAEHKDKPDSQNDGHKEEKHSHETERERIWRFQIGDNFGAYEYTDQDGYLRGFSVDLLQAVCRQAGKKCHYTVDKYEHCWDTHGGAEYPGIGLMDQWYDGCIGLFPSPDRMNAFNFTLPYTVDIRAGLHYKGGQQVQNPRNVTDRRIGFIDGWVVSKKCFNRQSGFEGNEVEAYTALMFESHDELIQAVNTGKVEAGLSVDAFDVEKLGLVSDGHWFRCTLGGASVMTRYGDEVLEWWNKAFDELRDNGGYSRVCNEAAIRHGHRGKVHCLE